MGMVGRRFSNGSEYRYGFNGKENDIEIASTSTYEYGFRIYNPALGRFLSIDPLSNEYAWNSPYAFAENDVIRSIDLDGLEKFVVLNNLDQNEVILSTTVFRVLKSGQLQNQNIAKIRNSKIITKYEQYNKVVINRNPDGSVSVSPSNETLTKREQRIISSKPVSDSPESEYRLPTESPSGNTQYQPLYKDDSRTSRVLTNNHVQESRVYLIKDGNFKLSSDELQNCPELLDVVNGDVKLVSVIVIFRSKKEMGVKFNDVKTSLQAVLGKDAVITSVVNKKYLDDVEPDVKPTKKSESNIAIQVDVKAN